MLNLLDNLLRNIIMDNVSGLREVPSGQPAKPVTERQVRFQPPDGQWRTHVKNLQRNALNIYLVDLRENRKLRSNERVRSIENGVIYEDPAPARLDCHYLISAWSAGEITDQIEPTLDEQALLYEVTAVLMKNVPLNPSRVYPANSGPLNAWPARFREIDLPTAVAPVEGFPKLAEFWGAMGQGHRWKPVLYLVVTIPVELLREVAGPMVTTRITEYRLLNGQPGTGEIWIQIGGYVLNTNNLLPNSPPVPVAGAWVQLETLASEPLQKTETDEQGRFTFGDLQAGRYQLRARATGLGEKTPLIDVPSPTGKYDISFP